MDFRIVIDSWPLRVPFVISRRRCETTDTLTLYVTESGKTGWGEAAGINYKGETCASMKAQLEQFFSSYPDGFDQSDVQSALPPGGARNALDCALWDLKAKTSGQPVSSLTGCELAPAQTAFTLSLDAPAAMARAAADAAGYPLLKLKLAGTSALECVKAVHQARPDAAIIVDANEALTLEQLQAFATELAACGVALIEQPLPRGEDDALVNYQGPVPLCADESCMTSDDVPRLVGRYDCVNIKLDKTGGLTEALALANTAQSAGLDLMVGCMLGTSLAMAPAMLVAPRCKFVDLDGALLLAADRPHPLKQESGILQPPTRDLWG